MNTTPLADYQQKLSIAMAKIEALQAVIENIEDSKGRYYAEYNVIYTRSEYNSFRASRRVLDSQSLYIKGMIKGIKSRTHTHWQTLEPKLIDYGYNVETDSWEGGHDAVSFTIMYARWAEIEPFKTVQNEQH